MNDDKKLQIEYIPLSEIIPYSKNPRKNDKAVEVVAKSISAFGFKNPIILDKNNEIVAGHTRLKAATKLGMQEVPVIWASDLTDEQVKAFRIMDNKSIEFAEWDEELLKGEFYALEGSEAFDFTGFSSQEISKIWDKEVKEDEFEMPNEPKYKIEKGEVWTLGEHRLMCGDSTNKEDVDKLMGGIKASILFTSPPYNVGHNLGYEKDSKYIHSDKSCKYLEMIDKSLSVGLDHARYVFYNLQFLANNKTDIISLLNNHKERFCDLAFWKKSQVAPAMAANVMNSQVECIFIWSKESNKRSIDTANFRGNVSNFVETKNAGAENKRADIHNATFPLGFASHFIENFTSRADIVLDNFGGIGTTILACEQLYRRCFMMELEPAYCSAVIERWEKLTGQTASKIDQNSTK